MPHFPIAALAWALSVSFALIGCDPAPERGAGPGGDTTGVTQELPIGSYPLGGDFGEQTLNRHSLIIRPGGEWEKNLARYTYDYRTLKRNDLVRLSREIGVYRIEPGRILLQTTHMGELEDRAGLTQARIGNFPFRRIHQVRYMAFLDAVTDSSFKAMDSSGRVFHTGSSWRSFTPGADSLDLTAPTPLPRLFETAPLLSAPGGIDLGPGMENVIPLIAGQEFTVDLTGGARNPLTRCFLLSNPPSAAPDTSLSGLFTVRFTTAGEPWVYADARALDGAGPPEPIAIRFRVAPAEPVITAPAYISAHRDHLTFVTTSVIDHQGDLEEITWDFDGDGTADLRSDSSYTPLHAFTESGLDTVWITARDKAGHEARQPIVVEVAP